MVITKVTHTDRAGCEWENSNWDSESYFWTTLIHITVIIFITKTLKVIVNIKQYLYIAKR